MNLYVSIYDFISQIFFTPSPSSLLHPQNLIKNHCSEYPDVLQCICVCVLFTLYERLTYYITFKSLWNIFMVPF